MKKIDEFIEKNLKEAAQGLLKLLKEKGSPDRVMIAHYASATSRRAAEMGAVYDFVFLRNDGYMLGVPEAWSDIAMKLYPDRWNAVLDVRTEEIKLYELFVRERSEQK